MGNKNRRFVVSKKIGHQWILKLDKEEEIINTVTSFCRENQINLGSISGIGAIDQAKIGFFDTKRKKYETRDLSGDLEIASLVGNVTLKDDKPFLHLHVTLANEEWKVFGGHLFEARVSATCEIFLIESIEHIARKLDTNSGLYLLDF
jgi:predicted DNA-binding protein with PD1-like motif